MIEFLLASLGAASRDTILNIIAGGLAVLFVLGSLNIIPRAAAAGLMLSAGIFGTFWGISNALLPLDFSPENMNDSVQALLDGMKTAFYTSLLGLLAAIVSRVLWAVQSWALYRAAPPDKKVTENPAHKDMNEGLEAIRNAIAGKDDSSLAAQVQKLRDENRDGFKKLEDLNETIRHALIDSLSRLMENLANDLREILAEQLAKQLRQLIENIETALVQQFGKTFAEFNEAVQALNKWQKEHRVQVEKLTEAFDDSAKSIARIKENCADIPEAMAKLQKIMTALDDQLDDMDLRLAAFADMRRQAQESFPLIKQNLDQIGADLQQSAAGLRDMKEVITANVGMITETMRADMQKTGQSLSDTLAGAGERFGQELQTMAGSLRGSMEETQKSVSAQINAVTETMRDDVQQTGQAMTRIITGTSDRFGREMQLMAGTMRGSMEETQKGVSEHVTAIVETMLTDLQQTGQDLTKIITDSSARFAQETQGMAGSMEKLQKGVNEHVTAIVETMLADMQQTGQTLTDTITGAGARLERDIRNMAVSTEEMQKSVSEHVSVLVKTMRDDLQQTGQTLTKTITSASVRFEQEIQSMTGSMTGNMEEAQRHVNAGIQETAQRAQTEISGEINRITQAWGESMVSIAEQYAAVIEGMREEDRKDD